VSRCRQWRREFPGRIAATPAEAVSWSDTVILCVRDDEAVRALMQGPAGVLSAMPRGGLVIDHSTTSVNLARELHALAGERGVSFLDAPLSGGVQSVRDGEVGIIAGGERPVFERARDLFQCYGRNIHRSGPPGSGQLMKMASQICLAGIVQSLAEALSFAGAAGLDMDRVLAVLGAGSARSWQLEQRGKAMVERDFSGAGTVSLLHKDMSLSLSEAARLGLRLPVAECVNEAFRRLCERGNEDWDAAGLIRLMETERLPAGDSESEGLRI
jgi:3-hydroxyisobutyrate dehydrogenase-like beta-hydroxyacid dehydrogenase